MDLSWLKPPYAFPVTGDAQRRDGERIRETCNENHICIMIQQLCLCYFTYFYS